RSRTMTLLREIQELATSSTAKVSDVLRKAKILAARLGHADFKQWVEHELNGYPSKEGLPKYRIVHTESFGHFSGPFGSGLKNAPIPLGCIPEAFRDIVSQVRMKDGVSYFEHLLDGRTQKGLFRCDWNADMTAAVGGGIYQDMNCIHAWQLV